MCTGSRGRGKASEKLKTEGVGERNNLSGRERKKIVNESSGKRSAHEKEWTVPFSRSGREVFGVKKINETERTSNVNI